MALAEVASQGRSWGWFTSLLGVGAAAAAVYFELWWLFLVTLLAVGDLFLLFIASGFSGILDLDDEAQEKLREKYSP